MAFFKPFREWFRPRLEPEVQQTGAALASSVGYSESAYFREAAKVNPDTLIGTRGYQVYSRMMTDEQVKAAIAVRRAAITGRDSYFELDESTGLSETERERRIGIFDQLLDAYDGSFIDGLNKIEKALFQGYSFTEKNFHDVEIDGKTYIGLRELRTKPYETFVLEVTETGDIRRLVQRLNGREQEIKLGKFVYFVHNPDNDEHYGGSELRSAYRAWFSKEWTIKFMDIFIERLAGGFVHAELAPETMLTVKQSTELQAVLTNISGLTSMMTPPGVKINVHFPPAGQVNTFTAALERHDAAIARSLLIPNLAGQSPQAQSGSFAQSETQFDLFITISDGDALRLEQALNQQLFKQLGELNFPDGIYPRFCLKPLSEKRRMQLAEAWGNLVQKGAVTKTDTDEAHLRDLLELPEKGTPDPAPLPALPGQGQQQPGRQPVGQGQPRAPSAVDEGRGETVTGRVLRVEAAAFARAERRVHFAIIDQKSEQLVSRETAALEAAVGELTAQLVAEIEEQRLGADPNTADRVRALKLPSSALARVRRRLRQALEAGVQLGEDTARRELEQANQADLARRVKLDRLAELAGSFFDSKSFQLAGDLGDKVLQAVRAVLLNAIKYSWTTPQIKRKLYEALVRDGLVQGRTAAEALGLTMPEVQEALLLEGGLSAYHLETVVRTNVFEAVNEARYNLFTDPELGGFVRSLQYSAILDSRTTAICRHLDGRVYPADSPVWNQWRPPNHFNCRSLLIAVTVMDEDEDTATLPSVEPQRGFG